MEVIVVNRRPAWTEAFSGELLKILSHNLFNVNQCGL